MATDPAFTETHAGLTPAAMPRLVSVAIVGTFAILLLAALVLLRRRRR